MKNEQECEIKDIVVLVQVYAGWQNLVAFRWEQKWQRKFLPSAFLQLSRQMRRFCA